MDLGLPGDLIGSVASSTTDMIGNLSTVGTLIVGILLAFLLLEIITGVFNKEET